MEEIDDFAPFLCYNMLLLSSLPIDQRGQGDFGAYLRADENTVRRMLKARGADTEVQAEDLFIPPTSLNYM